MSSNVNAQRGWPSSRIGGGLVASRRGLALAGLMLAGVGLWVALAFAVTLVVLGFGLFLIPGILLAVRSLTDPATWRDLLWLTVDSTVGGVIVLVPAGLVLWGLLGVVMPAVWKPIADAGGSNWYVIIHVTGPLTAWLSVPLGAVFVLLGLWTGRWLITAYFSWARLLLAPARSTGCAAETAGHWSVT